jgi:hypothetical protein
MRIDDLFCFLGNYPPAIIDKINSEGKKFYRLERILIGCMWELMTVNEILDESSQGKGTHIGTNRAKYLYY